MITAIILVVIIFAIFAVLNRALPLKICPICAGVSGSWLILIAGVILGHWSGDYKLPIAMLMGGTVVGIAFQGEAKFNWAKKSIYMWKAPVIILGMPIAYWLFNNMNLATFLVEILLLVLLAYLFFIRSSWAGKHKDSSRIAELEGKMKKCC